MAECSRGTKALARVVAAAEGAQAEFQRTADDSAYEMTYAQQWIERARRKHCARKQVDAQTFKAEVDAATRALE